MLSSLINTFIDGSLVLACTCAAPSLLHLLFRGGLSEIIRADSAVKEGLMEGNDWHGLSPLPPLLSKSLTAHKQQRAALYLTYLRNSGAGW